ncbi:hypothetical protein GGP41_007885 [Bipolaris sorokiniana]|uniref:Uncharacterized protein n=1 Tax=Cochliobolus sativus TaxID=45130 RepID=A0A8H5ZQR0_COCSA|nr:hypothetical protein GGP41_007885 [Bipolaris sorokiniana]
MPPKAQPPPRGAVLLTFNMLGAVNLNNLSLISASQISYAVFIRLPLYENIRRVFNYFYRPRGNSPYDAVFSPGPRDYSPMIAPICPTLRPLLYIAAALLTRLFIRIIAPLFCEARRSLPYSLAAYSSLRGRLAVGGAENPLLME